MNLIVVKFASTGLYRAYFDGTPKFYGEGMTREIAITELVEKVHAVLRAISNIQKER